MAEQFLLPGIDAASLPRRVTDGLFFAIKPDPSTSVRIASLAQRLRGEHGLKGKPLATDRFHVSLPQDPIPPPDPSGNRYRVTAGSLYVRQGPGTSYPAVGYLLQNDIVEALASNADGSWLRVRRLTDGLTGWASSTYLEKITTTPPPPPSGGDQYRVTANYLYIRQGPGTNFPSNGYLVKGDIVEKLEANSDGTWLRVRRLTDGLTGWASSTYLEKITSTPPPPPPTGAQKYRVTATRLYVREGPGTQYKSIGYVELNEIVTGISANADQTWRQIQKSNGLTGWCYARYLVPIGS